jgi:methylthioxylose transferase
VSPFRSPAYLQTATQIHDPRVFLSQFVQRIHSYNSHARGHPPGMELLLWATARVGLSGLGWSAALALGGGAAAGVAALVALRDIADEHRARAAMPFLVLAPAAIWWSSGDAFFAGVSAWAVTLVVLATGTGGWPSDWRALLGGLLFGVTAFLSYGLVLLVCIPVAVGVFRRRFRPLALAAVGALPVFAAFRAAGFSWFAGLAATRTQYWLGAASGRPYRYFVFADLAAFALAIGPAAAIAIARLRERRVWLLVGGALTAIALADLSGMSKAEVERIWLPFVPWVLLATCAFAADKRDRGVRYWLGLQAASALLIELAVRSPW